MTEPLFTPARLAEIDESKLEDTFLQMGAEASEVLLERIDAALRNAGVTE